MDVTSYGGSYLKAANVDTLHCRILEVEEGVDYNEKPCLILNLNDDQKWQLKARDVNALVALFGNDSDNWIGQAITLTTEEADYNGTPYKKFVISKYVAPAKKAAASKVADPVAPNMNMDDDDLPF